MPAKTKSRGKKSFGPLILVAPTGDLYFLPEKGEPRKVPKGSKLEKELQRHLTDNLVKDAIVTDLGKDFPQEFLDLLEAAFGPLGIWHILRRK